MRNLRTLFLFLLVVATTAAAQRSYFGFDKNGYPGDDLLPRLHQSFAYAGYWLNNPPGMQNNPWQGKRAVVRQAGFGFLILFNGRLDAQLQHQNAASLGRQDAEAAVTAAKKEGFARGAVIFLDQEEGGRLLVEQAAYLGAWIATVEQSGYGAGVYCSGVNVGSGADAISTAKDVGAKFPTAKLWVWNDQCPPAPGCVVPAKPVSPAQSGFQRALVWQYAVSPRRPEDTAACKSTYASDNQWYAPGLPHTAESFVDLNVSRSPDPSQGR